MPLNYIRDLIKVIKSFTVQAPKCKMILKEFEAKIGCLFIQFCDTNDDSIENYF